MSYWEGRAPRYSRMVEAANEAVNEANRRLRETLQREYPAGAAVRVVHDHGTFTGTVAGWDSYGARVSVRNDATGKSKKWWAAHVELLREDGGEA